MASPTHKKCHGVLLPADAFAANAKRSDGLQAYCRDCMKKKRADWNERNLDKIEAYNASRRKGTTAPAPDAPNMPAPAPALPSFEEAPATYLKLSRSAIVPSRSNPRTHFDLDFIKDLAASIKAHGLAQPILVRPLPGSRLEETYMDRRADAPRPTHEIVCGEQRWRACEIAGIRDVDVLVRNLTDGQVRLIQLVENLKRRDLHPMEEAEGYERLREEGMSAEDIAEQIGKGRSYVYKTLKLVELEPEAREAFYDGKLTRSTAELVAMRPPNLQVTLLKELIAADFHGEPMSFRRAKAHVESHYMLRLGSAAFKITDATLLPEAGSCRTCPKRSGANPQLFDDVSHADTCTDPTCFAKKKDAHYDRIKAAAEQKGQTLIVGREAKEIMPHSGMLRGYRRVDEHADIGGEMKTLRKVLGEDMPTPMLLEDPQSKELIEVLPTTLVGKLLKEQGITKPAPDTNDAAEKRRLAEKFEKTWRLRAIEKLDAAYGGDGFGAPVQRCIALDLLEGLTADERKHTCKLLELGDIATREAIEAHIAECPEDEIERVVFLLLAQHDMRELISYSTGKATPAPRLEAIAGDLGVDLDDVRAAVKKEFRAAASEKVVAAAAKAVREQGAGVTPKPARKPKTTKEEASAAIATALQAAERQGATHG
jgi:ParB/RepB/Spo0J family partition protein